MTIQPTAPSRCNFSALATAPCRGLSLSRFVRFKRAVRIRVASPPLLLFEIALVFVRLDHVARVIVNTNHSIMRAAEKLHVIDCIAGCVWFAVPQPTDWQRIGDQIDAAMIFTRANFVDVHRRP